MKIGCSDDTNLWSLSTHRHVVGQVIFGVRRLPKYSNEQA